MKTSRIPVLVTSALAWSLAAFAVGCASDPNKDVQHAESAHVEERAEYSQKAAEMDRKHAEQQAELDKKQESERADLRGETGEKLSDTRRDLNHADANMTQDRQAYFAKAKERLDKIDAKASLVSTKMANPSSSAKRSQAKVEYDRYSQQRDLAAQKMRTIPTVSNEAWAETKKSIDASLDDAEKAVSTAESKL
jgi:hypothetical protein